MTYVAIDDFTQELARTSVLSEEFKTLLRQQVFKACEQAFEQGRKSARDSEVIELELMACEPEMLIQKWPDAGKQYLPTPEGLWLSFKPLFQGFPAVAIRGPRGIVRKFVEDHWGEEALEDLGDLL